MKLPTHFVHYATKTQNVREITALSCASSLADRIEPLVARKAAVLEFEVQTRLAYGNDNASVHTTGSRRETARIREIIRSFAGIESEAVQEHLCAIVRHVAEAVRGEGNSLFPCCVNRLYGSHSPPLAARRSARDD
jgi:hypothetical protein